LNVGFALVDRESDQLVGISSESAVSQVNIGYIFRQIFGEKFLPQALKGQSHEIFELWFFFIKHLQLATDSHPKVISKIVANSPRYLSLKIADDSAEPVKINFFI
jgi:hypothetical protein